MLKTTIGIITIQGNNYGATLQATALNHFLNNHGFDAENLDYNDLSRVKNGLSFKQKLINSLWMNVAVKLIIGNRKSDKFEKFRRQTIRFSSKQWRKKEALAADFPSYDVYMTGSDQIWNPYVMQNDYHYLLAYAPDDAKKIAYASSFGKASLPDNKKALYTQYLSRFDHIAVREKSGVAIVSELLERECEQVLDPTLLLNAEEWATLTDYRPQSEPYILCYYMPGDKVVCSAIKDISEQLSAKTGYKIINLGLKEYYRFAPKMDCRVDAGPADFVHLFLGAEYVVTNSFHGTAFATNFQKKVFVPINANLNNKEALYTRMTEHLEALGLSCAIVPVSNNTQVPNVENVEFDYSSAHEKLQALRQKSIDYLIKSIEG